MEGPHLPEPNVKMTDALASYITIYPITYLCKILPRTVSLKVVRDPDNQIK